MLPNEVTEFLCQISHYHVCPALASCMARRSATTILSTWGRSHDRQGSVSVTTMSALPWLLAWQGGQQPLYCPREVGHMTGKDRYKVGFVEKLPQLPMNKMAAISQTITSNAFSWLKSFVFCFGFHWKFVPKGPVDNKLVLVQVMAWHRTGDKPLSELKLIQFTKAYMQQ